MFVELGEVTLKILEKRFQEANIEVEAISKILAEQHVPVGGRVLDIYCLIGKHAIALAERGYNVVGVDISPLMIKHANELAESKNVQDNVKFLVADPRYILKILKGQQKQFNAILSMYTYMGSYDEKTDQEILKQLRRLIAPQGVIIVEVSNRDYIVRHFQKASITHINNTEFHVERRLNLETSNMENTLRYYLKKGKDLKFKGILEVEHRVYSLHELISLLNRTGWTYVKSYGSFKLEQPTTDLSNLIVVGEA